MVIDGPDSWSQSLKNEGMIEKFVGLDFSDADTVFERCLEVLSNIKKVRNRANLGGVHA